VLDLERAVVLKPHPGAGLMHQPKLSSRGAADVRDDREVFVREVLALHLGGFAAVMSIDEMRRRPAMTMLSGPAASVAGALMHVGMSDGIYFEVGGTSTNLGLVRGGRPVVTYANVGGHDTYVSSLDLRVLGVGGGSLIRVGENAIADVGPRSAHIAGLKYACFAEPQHFQNAKVVLFEPKAGDGDNFVAVETPDNGRYALTLTCAANAARLTTPEMHCYAPPEAARAAFVPLAALLNMDIDAVAKQVLVAAAAKVLPVVQSLVSEHQLDADQKVLVGMGGGIGSLLPTVAEELGLHFEMAKDAEIISSIGAALSMVREVVERLNPNPSGEDLAQLRAETVQAIGRLGADPKTVDISVEIDRQTGRIRAIATGAVALRTPDRSRTVDESQARLVAAHSFYRPEEDVILVSSSEGAFVYTLKTGPGHSLRVVDRHGAVRLQRSNAFVRETTAGKWRDALLSMGLFEADDDADAFFGAVLLYGIHVLDLTGVSSLSAASKVVDSELPDDAETPLVVIGFKRVNAA
jgi:hypothetical protein